MILTNCCRVQGVNPIYSTCAPLNYNFNQRELTVQVVNWTSSLKILKTNSFDQHTFIICFDTKSNEMKTFVKTQDVGRQSKVTLSKEAITQQFAVLCPAQIGPATTCSLPTLQLSCFDSYIHIQSTDKTWFHPTEGSEPCTFIGGELGEASIRQHVLR